MSSNDEPVQLRTAADRIVVQLQIQRSNERFLAHPTSLSDERGQHALSAYASVESMRRLRVSVGGFVRVRQATVEAVLQVWPERGFWSRSSSSTLPELFVSATHADWTGLRLEDAATNVPWSTELAKWRVVRVERPRAAPFELELLRERWLARRVLERSGSVHVLMRNGVEAALPFVAFGGDGRWGQFSDDTVLVWADADADSRAVPSPVALLGDEAVWCERVVRAMLLPSERARLARHELAYERNAVLITGASGVGKTWLARAIAANAGARLFDCSLVSHDALEAAFNEAVQLQPQPCVLLLDDVDEMLPRAGAAEVDDDAGANLALSLQQIVLRMQRHHSEANICLLATAAGPTSHGRLFGETVELTPPTPLQRRALLRALWGSDADDVADRCHAFMVCDLVALCDEARRCGGSLERARQQFTASAASTGVGAVSVEALTRVEGALAGLAEQRAVLERALSCLAPARRRALRLLGAEAPRGVLLYGAPGCGKTALARHAAQRASGGATWHFAHIDAAELVRSTVGDSERRLAAAFARARQCAPCVLFIDELEALFGARDDTGSAMRKLVSQLLVEFDALTPDVAVLVIGATNRARRVDTALLRPGRFDHLVFVPPPDAADRAAIVRLYAARLPRVDADAVAALAASPACHNFSGADIAQLCTRAALEAVLRAGSPSAVDQVSIGDFQSALAKMRPSITMADLNEAKRLK